MKVFLLIILLFSISLTLLFGELPYQPRLIVAELITASWSPDAAEAYSGIDELQNRYSSGDVIPVRYYTSQNSGQYSAPEIENLVQEYSVSEFPSFIVNGKARITGVNFPLSNGLPYQALVEKDYYSPSPLQIEILNFDTASGNIEIMITMLSDTEEFQNATTRFILIEDNVSNELTNLARTIEQEIFSLSGQNNTITLNTSFSTEPSWDENNLSALVYVVDSEGDIVQAASTYPSPAYNLRAVVPNKRMDIGPATGLFEVEYFSLFNPGDSIDLTINIMIDNAPAGWLTSFCDEDGLCYIGPYDFPLESGEVRSFHANVIPDEAGMMDYHFTVQSSLFPDDYNIPFRYLTNDVDLLIIDSDGWSNYEDYSTAVLEESQYSYGVWNTVYADISDSITPYFDTLIWITGEREPALTLTETSFLRSFLDNGYNLFLSGQNIGKDLISNPLYSDPSFYHDYLQSDLITADTDSRSVSGVEDDLITDGLNFAIAEGDGADNQYSPEVIAPLRDSSFPILHYHNGDDSVAGIRSLHYGRNAKIIYLAFGFEAIDNYNDRSDMLLNSIAWFSTTNTDDDTLPLTDTSLKLLPSYPNPFFLNKTGTDRTTGNYVVIPFSVPDGQLANDAVITIHNVKGQLIKTLTGLELSADNIGKVIWDGKNERNRKVVSGVYFYKLTNTKQTVIRKMLIVN
jgi:hypothetical protein